MKKNIKISYRAPRGSNITCKGWPQEAALRMLLNNLDNEVAEDPSELIVYGGEGKAARNVECLNSIIHQLKKLENDQTLLIQSGKPVGIVKTHESAARVLIANSNIVPAWANWKYFRELEEKGLMMYGQMTAGSWIYIGTQGILQGTYETFSQVARKNYGSSLKGRIVLTAGLGGMGGAQPLSVTMNEGIALCVEVNKKRAQRRISEGYCEKLTYSVDEAIELVNTAKKNKLPLSAALIGNASDIYPQLLKRGFIPDIVTDQTSAHDTLNGYVPGKMSYDEALKLRKKDPEKYIKRAEESISIHVRSMLEFKKKGSVAFDYGNNIRQVAFNNGVKDAFSFPGFVPAYIRDLFCEGKGPFRWVALSGDKNDIYFTDEIIKKEFAKNKSLVRWINMAREQVRFQGLPARICWLGYGERSRAGELFNHYVKKGSIRAPIVIGRDHLDSGSVASPNRETESMYDGSDAVSDWPLLNALVNSTNGADWVSIHHGGGVGIGYSVHAGVVVVADGSKKAEDKLIRVLNADPLMGVIRHADAGYDIAIKFAKKNKIEIPVKKNN